MRNHSFVVTLSLIGFNAYADATTVSPDWATPLISGSQYDIAGDYPNNADLIADSNNFALYTSSNGATYPGILEDAMKSTLMERIQTMLIPTAMACWMAMR